MRRRDTARAAIATAAALAVTVAGHAELIEYTDRDAWLDGAGEVAEITFTEFPGEFLLSDQYEDLGILFTDVDDSFFYNSGFSDGAGADGGFIHDELRVSFAEPIQWLGTDFLGRLEYEVYRKGELVAISGGFHHIISPFGGIFSDVPFDAAILRDPTGGTTVDNLYFQRIVPAPGALAVWILSVVVSAGRRRRRIVPAFSGFHGRAGVRR